MQDHYINTVFQLSRMKGITGHLDMLRKQIEYIGLVQNICFEAHNQSKQHKGNE